MKEIGFKDIVHVVGLITGFVFIISLATFYAYSLLHSGNFCSCTEQIPIIIVIVASSGLFVGSFTYYFLIDRIVRKGRAKRELEKALMPFLKLLNRDEEKVVRLLLQNNKMSQTSIAKLAGLSRVKTTRVLQKLEDKEIIQRTRFGKTNTVKLAKHLHKILE